MNTAPASQIPFYDADHAREFARAQKAVRRKICKIYDISVVPDIKDAVLNAKLDEYLDGRVGVNRKTWQERVDDAAAASGTGLNAMKRAELDAVAKSIMVKFKDAFLFNQKAKNKRRLASPPYNNDDGIECITDILLNHITNESFSRIKSFGFTDLGTLSLTGSLIGHSVKVVDSVYPGLKLRVEPQLPSHLLRSHDQQEEGRLRHIDKTRGYWRRLRGYLEDSCPDHPRGTPSR